MADGGGRQTNEETENWDIQLGGVRSLVDSSLGYQAQTGYGSTSADSSVLARNRMGHRLDMCPMRGSVAGLPLSCLGKAFS